MTVVYIILGLIILGLMYLLYDYSRVLKNTNQCFENVEFLRKACETQAREEGTFLYDISVMIQCFYGVLSEENKIKLEKEYQKIISNSNFKPKQ